MYIENDNIKSTQLDMGSNGETLPESPETPSWGPPAGNEPGWMPESPETPPWGPPAGNEPGWMPESPETPPWGPPTGNEPGWMPESPETPPWGPPAGNEPGWMPESPETPPWGPPSGGATQRPPVIIVPGQPVRPNTGSSSIRFLYAATGQPPVNVWLGNRVVIRNMQFGNSTPYYQDNASRNREIRIVNARTGATLYRGTFTFLSGKAYTVPIINEGGGISLMSLEDEPCNVSYAGCIRAVNLSPNSGPVDVFMSRIGRVFQNVGTYEVTDYQRVRGRSYQAFVSEALPCTNNNAVTISSTYVECNNTRIAIMNTANVDVNNGVSYTLYIIGRAYEFPALQILPLESDLVY